MAEEVDHPEQADQPGQRRPRLGILLAWLTIFAASLTLYVLTANTGPQWQDSGEFIERILTDDMIGELGLALSHPLHFWLGRLAIQIPYIEPAFSITLLSAIGGALTVACVFGCVHTLTGRYSAALFAAASLALANTFWQLSTKVEVYTLGTAFLAAECWCLAYYSKTKDRNGIWGMFFFNGLGLANYMQAVLTMPVLAVVSVYALWRRHLSMLDFLLACCLWIVGASPYLGLAGVHYYLGQDLSDTLHSMFFGDRYASEVLNFSSLLRCLMISIAFPLYNFPNLLLPAAAYGLWRSKSISVPPLAKRALVVMLIIHALFAARYNVVDQHTFFLPVYTLLTIFGGIGAAAVWSLASKWRRWLISILAVLLLAATPLTYIGATALAASLDVLGKEIRNKPYRDDYTYIFIPWSSADQSAEKMSTHAAELAKPDGLILVGDPMAIATVRYQVGQHGLENVTVEPLLIANPVLTAQTEALIDAAHQEGRRIVIVPLDRDNPKFVEEWGTLERVGDLYLLKPPWSSSQPATNPTP
jgi:hypothetical protein